MNGDAGNDTMSGNAGDDQVKGGADNDTLNGNGGNNNAANRLAGLGADDWLIGNGGDDELTGGFGNDRLEGGDGTDTAVFGGRRDNYRVELQPNGSVTVTDLRVDGEGTDTLTGVEFMRFANFYGPATYSVANIGPTLSGAGHVIGTSLDEVIHGSAGADYLEGRGGGDVMYAGAGDDSYETDSAGDIVSEGAGAGYDTVFSSISRMLEPNVERLYLTGSEALNGAGNDAANRIDGNSAANTLYGNSGDDSLAGNGGNDVLFGGDGIDYLYGGDGSDTLTGGTSYDYLEGGIGNDIFFAEGSDNVQAGDGDDLVNLAVVTRGALVNLGSGGADVLAISASPGVSLSGTSYVEAFSTAPGGDTLDLTQFLNGSGFTGFVSGQNAVESGHLRFVQVGGDTLVQFDLNGGGDSFSNLLLVYGVQSADLLAHTVIPA